MGYARYAHLRMVPLNGAEETVDMMTAFSDAGGPTQIDETFALDNERSADINRRMRSRAFGYRWNVQMRFVIANADDTYYINQFAERAARDDWTLYLTVDAGATEHEVILRRFNGPTKLGGKTFVGAQYDMAWEGVELFDAPPALSSATPADVASPTSSVPVTACAASGLPTASETFRGCMRYVPGTPDIVYICLKQDDGSYEWIEYGSGGDT